MFAAKRLSELSERKRLLIAQGDLHRAVLSAECVRVWSRWEWLVTTGERLRGSPWLLAGGAVAGLLAARNWRLLIKFAPVALTGWRWLKVLRTGRHG